MSKSLDSYHKQGDHAYSIEAHTEIAKVQHIYQDVCKRLVSSVACVLAHVNRVG